MGRFIACRSILTRKNNAQLIQAWEQTKGNTLASKSSAKPTPTKVSSKKSSEVDGARAQAGKDGVYKAVDYNGKATWTAVFEIKDGKFDELIISIICDPNICNNQVTTSNECSLTRSSEKKPLTSTILDCDDEWRILKGNLFGTMKSNGAQENAGAVEFKFLTGKELALFEQESRDPKNQVTMYVEGTKKPVSKLATREFVQIIAKREAAKKAELVRLAREISEKERLGLEKVERDRLAAETDQKKKVAAAEANRKRLAAEKAKKTQLVKQKAKRVANIERKRKAEARNRAYEKRLAEVERKRKAEAKRLADVERRRKAEAKRVAALEKKRKAAQQTASTVAGGGQLRQQLAVLKQLRADGFIDGQEFNSRKKALLDRFLGMKSAKPVKVARVVKPKNSELKKNLAKYSDVKFGKYHALVIGSNDYKYLPKLKTAKSDAKAVAKTLKSKYGYKVKTLINATRLDILDAFDEYREILTPDDNLLIYYAGHGYLDEEDNRGYWMPVDARPNRRGAWLSNADITGTLKALKANHVMVMADSCYSGTLTRGLSIKKRSPDYVREAVAMKARVVITSGGLEPVADKGGGNHSPFASVFLDVLNSNNGVLDGTKLFNKMRRPVMLKADQTPAYADVRKAGHEGGDFLFVRRR
jgi:hypothetical protein